EVAAVRLHSVRGGASDRAFIDIRGCDACARAIHAEHSGDRTGSGAEVDGCPALRQAVDRTSRKRLAEQAGHVDARIDTYRDAAEPGLSGDPGKWLAGEPAANRRVEELAGAGGVCQKLLRLLPRRDESFAGKQSAERRVIVRNQRAV